MYGFGYIEKGLCGHCHKPAHLFVTSKYGSDQDPYCVPCLLFWGVSIDEAGVDAVTHPIIAQENSCAGCRRIEFGDDKWKFTTAYLADHTPVEVHVACINDTNCSSCDTKYAVRFQYSYRDSRLLFREGGYESDRFTEWKDIEDGSYCTKCADDYIESCGGHENFYHCDHCDHLVQRANTARFEGTRYCNDCIENNVYTCDSCDSEYWDGYHECSADDEDENVIHSYSYRPAPYFFGSGQYHLGFELEVEARNNSRYEGAEMAQNTLGAHAYMKDDGSLNDGFEIVSHPHTLEKYHLDFDWEVLEKLKSDGYRSWNTETCGLHVHVSRTAFGIGNIPWNTTPTHQREALVLAKQAHELRFMKLIYDNQRQVERLAGRTSNRWANFSDKGKLVRKVKYGEQNNGRYSAINTENDATIEVRVFRGSLRKERVLSAIEFVTASVEYTRDLKVTQKNQALSWLGFTGYVSSNRETYPNLATIMGESFASDNNPLEN